MGWIQPIFQEINTQTNNTIDNPTRRASAVAILFLGGAAPFSGGTLPLIM